MTDIGKLAALLKVARAAEALRNHSRLELLPERSIREYVTPLEWHWKLQDAIEEADAAGVVWDEPEEDEGDDG